MNAMLALFSMGGMEIVLILAVILLLFGAKKLPELAKGLGQGIREFKKASSEVTSEIQRSMEEQPSHHSTSSPKMISAESTDTHSAPKSSDAKSS